MLSQLRSRLLGLSWTLGLDAPGALAVGLVTVSALLGSPGCGSSTPEDDATGGANTGGADGAGSGAAPGTGTGTGGGPGAGTDVLDGVDPSTPYGACVTYVVQQCRHKDKCGDKVRPVDEIPCPNVVDTCPDFLFSEGSTETVESVLACAADWQANSCDNYDKAIFPECSLTGGTFAVGEPCAFPSQCETRACSAYGTGCGSCMARVALGEICMGPAQCPNGSECLGGTCQVPAVVGDITLVGEGEDCAVPNTACEEGLLCILSSDTRQCLPPHAPGASCADHAYCSTGESCNQLTFLCEPQPVLNESCADLDCLDPLAIFCNDAEMCTARGGLAASCTMGTDGCLYGLRCECGDGTDSCGTGTCVEVRLEGQSCDAPGLRCAGGAECQATLCVVVEGNTGAFADRCEP